MYSGFPSIRIEGNEQRALALVPEAKVLLQKVQTVRDRSGATTFAMSRRAGDDGFIYVLSAGDQHIIHVSAGSEVPEQVEPEETSSANEGVAFPSIYSGAVYGGHIEPRSREVDGETIHYSVCTGFAPTNACINEHPKDRLVVSRQDTPRLAVRPYAPLEGIDNPNPPPTYSQYTLLRSSMYSGTMRKAVQAVMGLGRLSADALRDSSDKQYRNTVKQSGFQVRYDWRWVRTHGITFGADGTPWLVEISSYRGVHARPLPMFPGTTTSAYAARVRKAGNTSLEEVLNEFGGIPNGEAFPGSAPGLEDAIRRGDVIRLATVDDLYPYYGSYAPYSSAMGWAFNDRGTEAHITGYRFDDVGFQRGAWYGLRINIGALNRNRRPGQPVGSGTATLRKYEEGYIYCFPARAPSIVPYVPFKIYEPMLGGLLSHNGVPDLEARTLPPPRVDTVMFVAFINGSMHTVRYFRDPDQHTREIEDDRPETCMYAGEWTVTEYHGDRAITPSMYTNVYDPREQRPESVDTTVWTSTDLGWSAPHGGFPDRFHSHLARSRIFRMDVETSHTDFTAHQAVVVVPMFCREAYYYAIATREIVRARRHITSYGTIEDVNTYLGTHNGTFGVYGAAVDAGDPTFVIAQEMPGAPIDNPARYMDFAVIYQRRPNECGYQYADEGSWFELHQQYDVRMPGPVLPPSSSYNPPDRTTETAKLRAYFAPWNSHVEIPVTYSQVENHWMRPSPDPETGTVYNVYAEYNGLGADAVVYNTNHSSYTGDTIVRGFVPGNVSYNEYPALIGVVR